MKGRPAKTELDQFIKILVDRGLNATQIYETLCSLVNGPLGISYPTIARRVAKFKREM